MEGLKAIKMEYKIKPSLRAQDDLENELNNIKSFFLDNSELVLDFSDTLRIDSSGLGLLIRLLSHTRKTGGELKLKNINKSVANLFLITKLEQVFEIIE